jgi:hypothetical protein
MAHGTPSSLDDMPEYLRLVRGGRPPSAELVAEMRHNYEAIGGRSPLTEMGVNVKDGDYLVAINGKAVAQMASPFEALVNMVDKPVILTVNSEPKMEGAREVTIVPIADESQILYRDWVNSNLTKVEQATGGKVGYLHVPDMQQTGLNEFVRQFGPQLRKKALIIDVRGNGGGNILCAERLLQVLTAGAVEPSLLSFFNSRLTKRICKENDFVSPASARLRSRPSAWTASTSRSTAGRGPRCQQRDVNRPHRQPGAGHDVAVWGFKSDVLRAVVHLAV